jgi:hypothetical protein
MWFRALAVVALLMLESETLAVADQQLKPVTFTVVDVVTKKPVTEFSYTLEITVPGVVDPKHHREETAPVHVKSPSGTFVVQAPVSCKIDLDLDCPDAVLGSKRSGPTAFTLLSADLERKFVVNLEMGVTVTGIVRDARTKRPVSGAKVVPGTGPMGPFERETERAATADENGRVEVHGVKLEWGVKAFHPDCRFGFAPSKKGDDLLPQNFVIELEPAEMVGIGGTIRDDEKRPVAGVSITAGDRKTTSAADGRFRLIIPSPEYDSSSVVFKKAGYADHEVSQKAAIGNELSIGLVPNFNVEGTVRSNDGRAIESFTAVIESRPDGPGYDSVTRQVHHPSGHFSAVLKFGGQYRVVVRAADHAVWEGTVDVRRKSAALEIQLQRGVKVSGRVERPIGSRTQLRASLIPNPKEGFEGGYNDKARELSTLAAEVRDDGTFHLDHVRSDNYLLRIDGPEITPVYRLVHVADGDVDCGAFTPLGTGRIVGTIHRLGGLDEAAWSFAYCAIARGDNMSSLENGPAFERQFIAGEDGRFVIENVPAGQVYLVVHFPQVFDVVPTAGWTIQVVPGKTSEVRTFDRGKGSRLATSIVVGDGSRRHFELGSRNRAPDHTLMAFLKPDPSFKLEIVPHANETSSFSEESNPGNLSDRYRVLVKDVSPGSYHLRLLDASGGFKLDGGLLYEGEVVIKDGAQPARIALNAASIVGTVGGIEGGEVIAIDRTAKARPRRGPSFSDETFSIQFVPDGTYQLIARDPGKGWCRGPQVEVRNDVAKAAPMKLIPGGEIHGKIVARTPCEIPDAVVAVDAEGIEICDERFGGNGLMQYRIPHLWPGEWTIRLLAKDQVITSTRVKIAGTETIESDLVVDSKSSP